LEYIKGIEMERNVCKYSYYEVKIKIIWSTDFEICDLLQSSTLITCRGYPDTRQVGVRITCKHVRLVSVGVPEEPSTLYNIIGMIPTCRYL
jgi:hypothetical protein